MFGFLSFFLYRYLNSCLTEPKGPTDEGFQATLLECAADDQKEIRKKLQILLDKMEAMSGILSSFDPKLAWKMNNVEAEMASIDATFLCIF